jgi:hypothetical protein
MIERSPALGQHRWSLHGRLQLCRHKSSVRWLNPAVTSRIVCYHLPSFIAILYALP